VKEYPYWWDTLRDLPVASPEPPAPTDRAALPPRADVVIIGAGYTGLAAARHLARTGASVLVLERDRVGAGASSRNGGQVLTGLKLDPATLVDRFGEAHARQLFAVARESMTRLEAIIAEEPIDCGYTRTGHIQAATKAKHFKALEDEQALLARVFDHRVEIVPRADQRSEIGSDAYHGLLVDEQSAALNPAKYVEGLACAAARSGATVVTHTAVTRVDRIPTGWRLDFTGADSSTHEASAKAVSRTFVEARDVLVATDGYTTGVTPGLQRRLIPVGSFIIATEPLEPGTAAALLPKNRVAFDSKYILHYYRVTPDRRLLFGGRAEFHQPDDHTAERTAEILRADMVRTFPELRDTRVEYSWGGNVAFSRDQMPRAGRLDGLYYAGGYCGHGVAMATYLGEQIARRMAGEQFDHPLFDDDFASIPLYYGTPWFLPVVGAYYRVKDWLQ
jgi:glycine/D-amino acid oxidase-like deaminating enzyme